MNMNGTKGMNMTGGGHSMGGMGGHHMWMYFHTTVADTVLFSFWNVESAGGMVLSCFIVFLAAVGFEALKWTRIVLEINRYGQQLFSGSHLLQTFLFAVQVLWGYLLMLIFMTFSVWLGLAVTLGAATGYLLFGNIFGSNSKFWESLYEDQHRIGQPSSSANLISRTAHESGLGHH
ncbi:ctr copper transporter family domain-containing protein [Ditylenchus destructor]|uniref:Copper transport protein n=1 Tax=Ditylenchus destructor TaxID=166010 RepID=A0AAD4MZE8_9BILA|nr:ctr copper transporter family domain-containing protein [Ditylenchus destructor]